MTRVGFIAKKESKSRETDRHIRKRERERKNGLYGATPPPWWLFFLQYKTVRAERLASEMGENR